LRRQKPAPPADPPRFDEARLRLAVAEAPGDPSLRRDLAEAIAAAGRADEAAHAFRLADAAEAAALPHPVEGLADALAEVARDHIRAGRLDDGQRLAALVGRWRRSVSVIVPDLRHAADTDRETGDSLRRDGKIREAEAVLLRALARKPRDAKALRSLSALYRDSDRLDEALNLARLSVALRPDAVWFLVQLGNVLAMLGRAGEAAAAYRAAQALDTELPGVAAALADQLEALGDHAAAAQAQGLAAAEAPDDAALARRTGQLWESAGRPAEAVPWYRRAKADAELRRAQDTCPPPPPPGRIPDDPQLLDALRRVPLSIRRNWNGIRVKRLGGSHNAVYRVETGGRAYALRLGRFPGARWDLYAEEAANMRAAHAAGLAPEVLYFDEADGTLLTPIARGRVLDDVALLDHAVVRRAGQLYATLHQMPRMLGTYDLPDERRRLARHFDAAPPPPIADLGELRAKVTEITTMLAGNGVTAVPCHNDPIPLNMVDDGKRIVLLDWQCSGMADPDWEVGSLAALAWLDGKHQQTLFTACYGDPAHPHAARAALYRPVCRYLWVLTALERQRSGLPEDNWRDQLDASLGDLREMLAEPDLPARLELLRHWRQPSD
jgi:thiamine kinase-like enzyme/tetratricopeptide (TPR) repeat protein